MWDMDLKAVFEETDNPFHGGCYEDMKTSVAIHLSVIVLIAVTRLLKTTV